MMFPRLQHLPARLRIPEIILLFVLLSFTLFPCFVWLLEDISSHRGLILSIRQLVDKTSEAIVDVLDRITDDIVTGHANTPLYVKGLESVRGKVTPLAYFTHGTYI